MQAPLLISRSNSAHMLSNDFRRTEPEKQLQTAEYYRNIIQLSESGKKIGHQISRKNKVSEHSDEQQLWSCRNSRILDQPMNQPKKTWQVGQ
jgi:hypothetical protein